MVSFCVVEDLIAVELFNFTAMITRELYSSVMMMVEVAARTPLTTDEDDIEFIKEELPNTFFSLSIPLY
jgi:hypothetical protein